MDLTADQVTAMTSIRDGLAGGEPMVRLLQGDVGSGKTAVAAYGLAVVALGGAQGALLAPTDLLARQHVATLTALLEPLGLAPDAARRLAGWSRDEEALEPIADGRATVVVGTHALLQDACRSLGSPSRHRRAAPVRRRAARPLEAKAPAARRTSSS